MAEYAFGADEYVVMKTQEVTPDGKKGLSSMRTSELILTNHNIVLPIKGITGKVKGFEVYPLDDIRRQTGRYRAAFHGLHRAQQHDIAVISRDRVIRHHGIILPQPFIVAAALDLLAKDLIGLPQDPQTFRRDG